MVCNQRIIHYCPDSVIYDMAHFPVTSTDAPSEAGFGADVKLSSALLKSFDLGELAVLDSFIHRSSAE
jgi:hypothetical protein